MLSGEYVSSVTLSQWAASDTFFFLSVDRWRTLRRTFFFFCAGSFWSLILPTSGQLKGFFFSCITAFFFPSVLGHFYCFITLIEAVHGDFWKPVRVSKIYGKADFLNFCRIFFPNTYVKAFIFFFLCKITRARKTAQG